MESPQVQGYLAGLLPIKENWSESIAAEVFARTSTVHYQDIRIPEVQVDAQLGHRNGLELTAQVLAAPSSIKISASVPIPKPGTTLKTYEPLPAETAVDIHSLNDFLNDPNVLGIFSAGGVVTMQNLEPDGKISFVGSSVDYRGLTAQTINLELNFAHDHIEIAKGNIDFGSSDTIDIGGTVELADPFRYHLDNKIAFQDLRLFNSFLNNFVSGADLAGKLAVNLQAAGTAKNTPTSTQLLVDGDNIGFHGLKIQQLLVKASTANDDAKLSALKILFDQKNHVDMAVEGKLTSKYPYSGHADVELDNLEFLNPVLRAFHQDLGPSRQNDPKLGRSWRASDAQRISGKSVNGRSGKRRFTTTGGRTEPG